MAMTITTTVDEYDLARGVKAGDLGLLAIVGVLSEDESAINRDKALRHEVDQCEDQGQDVVAALAFLKRWTASLEAYLWDQTEYADEMKANGWQRPDQEGMV